MNKIFIFTLTCLSLVLFSIIEIKADENVSTEYVTKNTKFYQSSQSSKILKKAPDFNTVVNSYNVSDNNRTKVNYDNKDYYVDSVDISSNPKTFNESYGVTHYTRYQMIKMLSQINEAQFHLPNYDAKKIKDLTVAKDQDHQGFLGQQLDVWDSWPLKNKNGTVTNYHGYYITFALTGNMNYSSGLQCKIYMFYQKVSDSKKGISSWKSAGPILLGNSDGNPNAVALGINQEVGEWSGSTILQGGHFARVFYTSYSGGDIGRQTLATAKIYIEKTHTGLKINHNKTADRRIIFKPDGKNYETLEQWKQYNNLPDHSNVDGNAFRDPNYFEANHHKYLIFEANTGMDFGGSGDNTLNNDANFGGSSAFRAKQREMFNNNSELKSQTAYNNAALGVIELNNDYTVKKVFKPLIVFNNVQEETERPSVVHYKNKWYLFTDMHGYHMADSFSNTDPHTMDSYMLGFVSKNPLGPYKPLNKNGLVLYSSQPWESRTLSYSYNVIQKNNAPFVITDYMSSIGNTAVGHSTFGPSALLKINDDKTKIVQQILQQGQLTYK